MECSGILGIEERREERLRLLKRDLVGYRLFHVILIVMLMHLICVFLDRSFVLVQFICKIKFLLIKVLLFYQHNICYSTFKGTL